MPGVLYSLKQPASMGFAACTGEKSFFLHRLNRKTQRLFETDAAQMVLFYRAESSSWMAAAAFLPAPMARITVAAPVTASPPA